MSVLRPRYEAFLGTWHLMPESCRYEQGEPPKAARYTIAQVQDELQFTIAWTDAKGQSHEVTFGGKPDGVPTPFDGKGLADALSITAVSDKELNSAAFLDGREISTAQRQLDTTRCAMRVTQVVRVPSVSVNVAIYVRAH